MWGYIGGVYWACPGNCQANRYISRKDRKDRKDFRFFLATLAALA
jgi:hypothetical protein